MKKYLSWNNRRRNAKYWFSIELLLFLATNISWYLDLDNSLIHKIGYILEDMFESLIVFGDTRSMSLMCVCATFMLFLTGIIMLVNHLVGMIPDIGPLKICGLWQVMSKSTVWGDIALGIILEAMAIHGFLEAYKGLNPSSLITWFYAIFFFEGSYSYWMSVFPVIQYRKVKGALLKGKDYQSTVWFGISNADIRISTFDRAPRKGRISEIIIDQQDLDILSGLSDCMPDKTQFLYYLICIDCNKVLCHTFRQQVMSAINIPHARTLVCCFGSPDYDADLQVFLRDVTGYINVQVKHCSSSITRELDMERYIGSIAFKQYESDKIPTCFVPDEQLKTTYLGVADGPGICLDFLKMITNKLETLPAIYALFDYVDLLYRISIAYAIEPDYRWIKKHWRVVGNVTVMATIVESKVLSSNLSAGKIKIGANATIHNVFSDSEQALIRKYLPNYQEDRSRPIYDTVVYLTASLRNVLRGHGYFDTKDADDLYRLVFKLALMNMHILAINEVHLATVEQVVWVDGSLKYYAVVGGNQSEQAKKLSPFLVASENGNILAFNNRHKAKGQHDGEQLEYINYLDGTVVLPEFRTINVPSASEETL